MDSATPKEALNKAVGEVQTYLETSKEYLKLQAFKMTMQLMSSLAKVLLVGLFALLALLFLSYSVALGLGAWMGSATYGFLAMGGSGRSRKPASSARSAAPRPTGPTTASTRACT